MIITNASESRDFLSTCYWIIVVNLTKALQQQHTHTYKQTKKKREKKWKGNRETERREKEEK